MNSKYAIAKTNWLTVIEGVLIFYFLFGIIQAFTFKNYGSIPLLLMAFTGFSMVFFLSMGEKRSRTLALSPS
jgi:hypothetical protein